MHAVGEMAIALRMESAFDDEIFGTVVPSEIEEYWKADNLNRDVIVQF